MKSMTCTVCQVDGCEGYHTPENPAQEKRVWWPSYADETKIPAQESICTCSIKSIRHSSFCPVSLLKDWPKAETKMSVSSFTGSDPTKKPPIEEAASGSSTDDTDSITVDPGTKALFVGSTTHKSSIHDEAWEKDFDETFDPHKHWQGDEWVTKKVKSFIRNLLSQG